MIFNDLLPPESLTNPNLIFSFNSNSIENCISNIPYLSEKFIYFNDDFFIGKRVELSDFFDEFDRPIIYVNEHNYNNVENDYKFFSYRAKNDYGGDRYKSGVTFTVYTFKQKFGNVTNLEHLHVAYPTTKNILKESRKLLNDAITDTIKSPFRGVNDITMQHSSFQYGMSNNLIHPIPDKRKEIAFICRNIIFEKPTFLKIYQNKIKMFCINIDYDFQKKKMDKHFWK